MKKIYNILFLAFIAIGFFSCSTKKNTFISRNWHALNTKYNVLFNGKEAFKKGLENIRNQHQDNFLEQLTIEPITFAEEKIEIPVFGPGGPPGTETTTKADSPFDKAEEKAVKAIQKHSMNISGREYNRQMDDAYLLLGKSRYYSQRFVPAIEAFDYIITNYWNGDLVNETKIWKAKANIRIENEELAIESLKLLLNSNKKPLTDVIKEEAYTALAMAYLQSDSIQRVKEHLQKATETSENIEQFSRNLFILGQIYSKENKKDSASFAFKKLVEFKKAPYKYHIYANIELAKNRSKDASITDLVAHFKELTEDRENRPYLDALYYQAGNLEESRDSTEKAIVYYKKSLQAKNGGNIQKTYTYEKLGNIEFKRADYLKASSYYDSVLKVAKDTKKLRIRRIKRKHKSLKSLIDFETILKTNDSILAIASMSKNEQKQYFENYIAKLKKEDKEKAQQQLNNLNFGTSFGGSLAQNNNKGKWYFYNVQSLGFGKAEFKKVWGNRPLEDNWRWSDKTFLNTKNTDSLKVAQNAKRYDLATYLRAIPTAKKSIDSLKNQRKEALYQLGLIYKEQFKNTNLATKKLQRLLSLNPDTNLILPINYHLYKIYSDEGNQKKANLYKKVVVEKYPDSKYAQIILYPDKELKEEKSVTEIEKNYKEIYYLYKEDKFKEVVEKINEILPTAKKSKLIAKFELLKAYAIGKYQGKKEYKKAMEFVVFNYGNTEEGKKAKQILEQLKK